MQKRTEELQNQRQELLMRAKTLNDAKLSEQKDVTRLEGRSLSAFFYNVVGKLDEKLTREREEAYAAAVKYDAAARELADVEQQLSRNREELAQLQNCERQYTAALEEKAEALLASGAGMAEELLRLEEEVTRLRKQKIEIDEAVRAGQKAKATAEQISSSLQSAEGWGTWDLFGGGLISDLAKHSHLDEAQEKVEQLQLQLRTFKTELADVHILSQMQVNIDGFLRFADYFFDGLFADWAVMDHIEQSIAQLEDTDRQLDAALDRLAHLHASAEQALERAEKAREELLLRATEETT